MATCLFKKDVFFYDFYCISSVITDVSPTETFHLQVTTMKLDGANYHIWSASFELYVNAQGKHSHLISDALAAPFISDAKVKQDYNTWIMMIYMDQ